MNRSIRLLLHTGTLFMALGMAGTTTSCAGTTHAKPAIVFTDAEQKAATQFESRIAEYAALHDKLAATLPALPDKASPEEMEAHQQAMAKLITTARKDAKAGEFFTIAMQGLIKRTLAATVSGVDDKETKQAVMEDNPGYLSFNVNSKYPEGVPVSSMPIEFLETLPKLDEELEYRFLGKRLVLLDSCSQVIVDITPNVIP